MAVMMLAERGAIDLDRSVEKYIKPLEFNAYRGKSGDVTVRHLLNHTAGLPMHFNYFYEDEAYDPPDFGETLYRYGILVHEPGRVFQVSNLGYEVLGHIVSEVSGLTYEEFMASELFEPMGMATSWVGLHPEYSGLTVEKYDSALRPIPPMQTDTPAAMEAHAGAYDLVRFGMFHLKNNLPGTQGLLSKESIEAMQTPGDGPPAGEGKAYGLGWFITDDDKGYRTVWHEGGIAGASSMLKLVPSENIALVVLINGWSKDLTERIADGILGTLLPEYAEKAREEAGTGADEFVPYRPDPELTADWKGEIRTYAGDIPVRMVFQEDGDIHFLKPLDIDRTWVLEDSEYSDRVLNDAAAAGNRLRGWLEGTVPTGDASRYPHVLVFDLVHDGDRLEGSVTAMSAAERMYFGLSYYIALKMQD
jgi:CubicO group peptidase (beta-lactamase class C family)